MSQRLTFHARLLFVLSFKGTVYFEAVITKLHRCCLVTHVRCMERSTTKRHCPYYIYNFMGQISTYSRFHAISPSHAKRLSEISEVRHVTKFNTSGIVHKYEKQEWAHQGALW